MLSLRFSFLIGYLSLYVSKIYSAGFPYITFYLHCVMLKLSFNFEMLCDRIALEICHFLGSLDIIIWCSAFMPKVLLMVAITLRVTSRLLILSEIVWQQLNFIYNPF